MNLVTLHSVNTNRKLLFLCVKGNGEAVALGKKGGQGWWRPGGGEGSESVVGIYCMKEEDM